jgi:predicted DNA-binding protein (MmcQ/YjbR family)
MSREIIKAPAAARAARQSGISPSSGKDRRLQTVSDICAAWPEVTMERSDSHATFRVRKKVFAYFLDNHHVDGIVSVCAKTELGENRDLARQDPERFYLPAYIGPRGWVGLRLDTRSVDWSEVAGLMLSSYRLVAPKKLAAAVRKSERTTGD